jgi:hypothetical protein
MKNMYIASRIAINSGDVYISIEPILVFTSNRFFKKSGILRDAIVFEIVGKK